MRLMKFEYTISHVPGKLLYTADALSRSPLPSEDDAGIDAETSCYVQAVVSNLSATNKQLEEIKLALQRDDIMKAVMHHTKYG